MDPNSCGLSMDLNSCGFFGRGRGTWYSLITPFWEVLHPPTIYIISLSRPKQFLCSTTTSTGLNLVELPWIRLRNNKYDKFMVIFILDLLDIHLACEIENRTVLPHWINPAQHTVSTNNVFASILSLKTVFLFLQSTTSIDVISVCQHHSKKCHLLITTSRWCWAASGIIPLLVQAVELKNWI